MNLLTCASNGHRTVQGIYDKMQTKDQIQLLRLRRGDAPPENVELLIRWASRVNIPAKKTINQSSGIGLASDKGRARLVLQEAGVSVPKTIVWTKPIQDWTLNFPVVLRPQFHQGGQNFWLIEDEDELHHTPPPFVGSYFSEFYPKQNEYRVHVAHGKVLLVNEKRPREGEEDKVNLPVWNHATNDFEFVVLRRSNWPIDEIRLAIQAVEVLGLDYGAVDIMANPTRTEDGPDHPQCVVCEVNTSPTLEDYAQGKYAKYFDWLLSGEREHYPLLDSRSYTDYLFIGEG